MPKYTMKINCFNLKTNFSRELPIIIRASKPLITYEEDSVIHFNFEEEDFKQSCAFLDNQLHPAFSKKLISSIKRRLRGTSKGIQVVYRDEDNLIWHCFVEFTNTFK